LLNAPPDTTTFTNDPPSITGFDNNGAQLDVSPGLRADYEETVELLAASVVADPARMTQLMPGGVMPSGAADARAFITSFGERAFRRPLNPAEVELYLGLFQQAPGLYPELDAISGGVQLTLTAMLQAPQFVYRVENAGKLGAGGFELSDYEVASRLSYSLWDSMPDAALFAAAKSGQLRTPEQIGAQAQRMLQDPRAARKLNEFHSQLLELEHYDSIHPVGLPEQIGLAMRGETERFVHDALVVQPGSLRTLLTANYSFVNADLAAIYGLAGNYGPDFVRAELDPAQRSGLLTQAGFLAARAGDTAPILRGVFINQKFLCSDLPPPPVFTPPKMTGVTRRERVDSITGFGTCGESCHARLINPAGFPLEYFDNAGRYRIIDSGNPIDGMAEYPFSDGMQAYNGPIEWSQTVASSREAHECYVRHWLEFGFGRAFAAGDWPLVRRVAAVSRESDLPVTQLLVQLVQSPSFRMRAVEGP
jgi:hypothetical protein